MTTYADPAEFAAALTKYADQQVQLIAKQVAGEVFTEISGRILEATPVLTGKARANWQPTVGDPAGGIINEVAGVSQTGEPVTGEEQDRLKAVVQQFLEDDSATQLQLTNNLPYIEGLDQGDSQKAPAGIVEPAISASLDALKDKGVV